jgi:PAS domain S-box-containing protein
MMSANHLKTNCFSKNSDKKTNLTLIGGLLIFVIYLILSKLFIVFSIHLGISSPILPGAGFAVVAYLVFGIRALLPIALAIIFSSIVGQGTLQWHYFPVSLFFAFGASLQAVVCGFIMKVKKINLNSLADTREIGLFFILSLLTALISTTISNIGLSLVGVDDFTPTYLTFLTWWFGDCVGIFIFAPLLFWLTRENKNELDKKQLRATVISLIACLSLVFVVFYSEKNTNKATLKETYQRDVENIIYTIEHELMQVTSLSKMLSSYIANHEAMSNDDFLQYTDIAIKSNENLLALSWNPLVLDESRKVFERKLGSVHNGKDFILEKNNEVMKIADKRLFYVPILLIQPVKGNEQAIGFDLYSNHVRKEALNKALQLNSAVATQPITIVQNANVNNAILLFQPVTKKNSGPLNNPKEYEKVSGFVSSIIDIERLINNVINKSNGNSHQIKMTIKDTLSKTEIYSNTENVTTHNSKLDLNKISLQHNISFANNHWVINAQPSNEYILALRKESEWFILFFGIIITAMFYAMVLFWSGRQKVIENIVKQQTNEINSRKKHLNLTLNSIADAVIVTNVNGIVIRVNPAAEKLLGMGLSVQNTVHIDSLFALLSGERANVFDDASVKIMNELCIIDSEDFVTLNKLDGTSRQVLAIASPIIEDKSLFQGIVFILKDISEIHELKSKNKHILVESDARHKALILSSNTGAWEFCSDINYLDCSPEYFTMLGRDIKDYQSKNTNNLSQLWTDLIHPEDREQAAKLFADYLRTPQGVYENNFRMKHKDGSWVWILSRAQILKDAHGALTQRVIGTHINITSQIETQKKLKHSQKMDALGKLTGGVAHDYNNMLAVIQGYADLLTNKLEPTSKEFRYVKEILKASDRGANLTQKLLGFVKTQQDNKEIFSLNELVLEQLDMLHKALTARIKVSVNILKSNPGVLANKNDLTDVLFNLCINSMHAIEHNGSIKLSTGLKKYAHKEAELHDINAGTYATFTVEDDGSGMDDKTLSQIFDPFFTTKGEKGTGLGLSQVYGFAKSNQGGITVTSELGKGTKITIFLPSRKMKKENIHQLNNDDKSVEIESGNVLIVDDELALLELAFEVLTDQGYNVKTAQSAEEALVILTNESIDLVVTDIIMPKIDGYQLASLIKDNAIDTKIAFVSGYNDESIRQNSDMFSQMNLLRKPYTGMELISFVNNTLNKK